MPLPRRYRLFAVFFGVFLVLDQITKAWARSALVPYGHKVIVVIQSFFDFRLSFNTGAAFGLFNKIGGTRVWLSALAIIACFVLGWMLRKRKDSERWTPSAFGLIASGALGNAIDRILFGRVTDFTVWKIPWNGTIKEWPAFNIADAALVAGVIILFLDLGKEQKIADRERKEAEAAARAEKRAEKKAKRG